MSKIFKFSPNLIIIAITLVSVIMIYLAVQWLSFTINAPTNSPSSTELLYRSYSRYYGNPNAPIKIVEFSDFQCPACQQASEGIKKLVDDNPEDIVIYFRHLPLPFHQHSNKLAKLAQASATNEQFWQIHDLIFANQAEWSQSDDPLLLLKKLAVQSQIAEILEQVEKEMYSSVIQEQVEQDMRDARQLKVQATPTFFINGYIAVGFRSSSFDSLLRQELSKLPEKK